MIVPSIRRIAATLFIVGALLLAVATSYKLVAFCGTGTGCIAATIVFGVPEFALEVPVIGNTSVTTAAEIGSRAQLFNVSVPDFSQATGIYLITIAVFMILILECFELYYLRRMFQGGGHH